MVFISTISAIIKTMRKFKKGVKKRIIRILLWFAAAAMMLAVLSSLAVVYWVATLKIPDIESLGEVKVAQSTKIYDRTGKIVLWDIHEDIQRTVIPIENISRHVKNATIAIEDSSFYQHKGVDFLGIMRSVLVDLKSGKLKQGGSTITQQLVKNTLLTKDKTFSRKIKEIILTMKIEKVLSKEQILERYLNEIPYGGSSYGIESASKIFFGKSAADINLAEAAYLASLPKAPTYYSPYGNHKEELETRKNFVLGKMTSLGFITSEEAEIAKEEKVVFVNKGQNSIKAAHFSVFIRAYLEEKYGQDVIEQGGLKVTTTLDYALQQKAEELAARYAKENKEKFNASNTSIVALDPKTGQILVMVGSKDYFNKEDQGNFNVSLAYRQPGSAIKPFVYAAAFKKGYTPETTLFDLQTEFNPSCLHKYATGTVITAQSSSGGKDECYMPENYDNKFRGPINLRSALAQSLNIPSVKTLYLAGIQNSLNTIKDMGISSLNDPNRYGLTLVLGGGEVSLFELTGAYSVFANNGVRNPPIGILKIEDKNGKVVEEFKDQSRQVLDKNVALTITDILSDNKARTPAFGENSPLYFPGRQVAAKTGTTNDYRDAWVVGYTPNLTVGAWFGNNDNSSMEKKVAGLIVAPMWNEFLNEVFKILPKENFEKPTKTKTSKPALNGEWRGEQKYLIDKISQKLATEHTPPELIEEKTLTEVHSILYWLNKDNPKGAKPEKPEQDPQFQLWEIPVRKWATENNIKDQTMDDIPKEKDDIHKPEYQPKITMDYPIKDNTYNKEEVINIKITQKSKFGLGQIDFFFNGSYIGTSKINPFGFSFKPADYNITQEKAELKIIAYDQVRNKTEVVVPFMVK